MLAARPQLPGGSDGVAKRTVEARRVFSRISQNPRIDQSGGFERVADRRDAAVHHVRGRDHIGTGIRMRTGLTHQRFHGQIVQDIALIVDQSILPVRRKGIKGDVGNDTEARKLLFHRPHRGLGDTVRIPGFARIQRLFLDRSDREQGNGRDLETHQGLALAQSLIDRQPLDARHGGHRLALAAALDHEHRVNQRVGAQVGFTHQTAGELIAPHAPHAGFWK